MARPSFYYLTLLSFLALSSGCSDNKEEPAPEPESFSCVLLKEQVTYPTPGEALTRDYHYEDGFITHVTDVVQGARPSTTSVYFDYGVTGDISSSTVRDQQGLPLEAHEFLYDNFGLLKQVNVYNKRQNPGFPVLLHYATKECTYNSKIQLINVKNWLVNSAPRMLLNDFTFTYDEKGNLTHMREYRVINYQETNPENFNDIVINQTFTHDDKVNPYYENPFVMLLPSPGVFIPGLSPNNIVTTSSVSTLDGTKRGPGPNYNPSTFNFARKNTYTYTDKGRAATSTSSVGTVRTFTHDCE